MNLARCYRLGVFFIALWTLAHALPAYAGCPGLTAPGAVAGGLSDVMYDPVAGVMKACVGTSWVSLGTGGGGAGSLAALSDVSTTGIGNGKALVYNSSTSKWEPQAISGGGSSSLIGLTDVSVSSPASGDFLRYNGTAWMNSAASAETDPTIGTLTSGKWCSTNGAQVICDSDAPGGGSSNGAAGAVQFSNGAGGFLSDNTRLHWDNTNKRLGIGTAFPGSKLDIVTSASVVGMRVLSGTDSSYAVMGVGRESSEALIGVAANTGDFSALAAAGDAVFGATAGNLVFSAASGAIRFGTDGPNIERMTINPSGNVGIGTANPQTALDVNGKIKVGVETASVASGPDTVPESYKFSRADCNAGTRGSIFIGKPSAAGNQDALCACMNIEDVMEWVCFNP